MYPAHVSTKKKVEQTVAEHCEAVCNLCEDYGAKIGLKNTAGLMGIMHDFGKAKDEFETYLRYCAEHPDDHSLKGTVNHSSGGAQLIFDQFFAIDNYQKLTTELVSLAICSHHGGLSDIISPEGIDSLHKKIHPKEDISFDECLQNFTKEVVKLPQINERFYKSRDEVIEIINRLKEARILDTFSFHLVAKYLFSCLIDADRLDTFNFMEDRQQEKSNSGTSDLWEELSEKLEHHIEGFIKESKISILRREISDACKNFAQHKPGIFRLCVPTGGGKTLSSLRYALEHAKIKAFKKERIFYIIPFTTIIDQNARVIKDILKRDDVILEHHSNLVSDNDNEDYKLLTERWNSPIIMTTMVQFLNTLFAGGTQDIRRMHNLANSIIIFDEIQSVPIKCVHLLNNALNFLSRICNATIILCTATQPLLSETRRPLKIDSPADIIEDVDEKFRQFKRVNIVPSLINGGYEIGRLAEFVLEKMDNIRNALVILNTKTSARNLFKQLGEINSILPEHKKFQMFHLSTSMCPKHRLKILDKLKSNLENDRVICISTQLIEAGVDISFECVIRAIAGLDGIAQAAGRCNRHKEKSCANVYIVNIKNEDLSKLLDIQEGRDCTIRILGEYEKEPGAYDNDLLSPKTMERYYQYYFYSRKDKMDYNIINLNTSMYDLLSANPKGTEAYEGREGKRSQYLINQAFKTAGDNFCVIDNNTTSVLVPYDKGEDLIIKINGKCSFEELKAYIKEAQQYSVNLFENDIKKIGKGIYPLMNGGILALDRRFYDEENLGVITEGKQMEFLSE